MSKATILLVQDARTQGNSTKRYLEIAGYTVVWAGSGMSALLAAGKYAVDLILLDVSLPDIDGSDLCHRFRSRQSTLRIPIILFTAHEPQAGTFLKSTNGPDAYLAKPFTQAQLSTKIGAVLDARAKTEPAVPRSTPAAEIPTVRPMRSEPRGEPTKPMVPGPRSALKPKPEPAPEPETVQAVIPALQASPTKPVLRLVPKPQPAPAAAEASPMAKQPEEPAVTGPASSPAQPFGLPGPPFFSGSIDQVVDPSTGLFGRPQFEAMFSKEFKRAVRFKQQMSCMLIDLDGSDMGRKADENLVKALIGVVQRTIREVDTAAWWTGGTLIVLLPNTMRNDAVQAGMRILEAVAVEHFTWPDSTQVTVNIGVAGLPDRKIDSEQKLIEAAALACRRARQTMLPLDPAGQKGDR